MNTAIQNPAIEALIRERDSVASEIERLQADIKIARHKLRSFEDAISILTGVPAAKIDGSTLKELVLDQLTLAGVGMTPIEISNAITASGRETSNTSVSPILTRLLKDGAVEKTGDKWRSTKTQTVPGASTSGTVNELGPATGRGTVFPATPPEGSIPSGSTVIQDLKEGLANVRSTLPSSLRDLDDEIPF